MEQQTGAPRPQAVLGKNLRVRVTRPMGAPYPGGGVYGANYGEVMGFFPVGAAKPDGVFVLGLGHPVRFFDGRVIALLTAGDGKRYAVCAPKARRLIKGDILRALSFAFREEDCRLQCLYEHSCGAVIFRREEGALRFLLIKNRRSVYWGFPKGHVENDETPEQTARREVLEETGLRVRLLPGFSCQSEYVMQGGIEKCVTIFLAQTDEARFTMQEAEIEDCQWADFRRAIQMLRFENDRVTLRRACAFLRRQEFRWKHQ